MPSPDAVLPAPALPEARVAVLTGALAALVFVPYLGAVGLWDPWETHYSEVGRSMLERGDLIHPFWEKAWFFSKPPLTPWLAAAGLWAVSAGSGTGELPLYAEWAIRLPFAALAIAAVALLSHAVARLASRAAGLACGLALTTMPLFFFTARQAMTDMPFVACVTVAWACALLGQLGEDRRWWWGFYLAMGLAALGKGLLAGLPTVVFALWWGLTRPASLRAPGEPIAAFMMDWKGETFYSRNQVVQLGPNNAAADLPRFLARPGHKWVLVEHGRLNVLRGTVGPQHALQLIDPALNNKFVLVRID